MRNWMALGMLALAGCCFFGENGKAPISAVSPDGKNEIRLWTNPLAYEVSRAGKVLVAKTEIGMKVDGKCLASGSACCAREKMRGLERVARRRSRRCFAPRAIRRQSASFIRLAMVRR